MAKSRWTFSPVTSHRTSGLGWFVLTPDRYVKLADLVDHIFPPLQPRLTLGASTTELSSTPGAAVDTSIEINNPQSGFNDFSYWREPIAQIEIPELEAKPSTSLNPIPSSLAPGTRRPASVVGVMRSNTPPARLIRTTVTARRAQSELNNVAPEFAPHSAPVGKPPNWEGFEDPGQLGDGEEEPLDDGESEYEDDDDDEEDDEEDGAEQEVFQPQEMSSVTGFPYI